MNVYTGPIGAVFEGVLRVLFGKRRQSPAARPSGSAPGGAAADTYVVAYERMLKGNQLLRRGRPIRQVAIVVHGTAKLVTSGDMVDRKTYEALVLAGVLAADDVPAVPDVLEADEPLEDVPPSR